MEITQTLVKDFPGYFKVFTDGSVWRYDHPVTPASEHVSLEGSKSKDIVIDPANGVWARLYLPDHVPQGQKLPLLFYFHGGGFCFCSTAWENWHLFVSGLTGRARVLVISIDYHLAPEHRLPAAYDDCCNGVEWVALGEGKAEPWLESYADYSRCFMAGESYADYSRCFMAGESTGGNIVHVVGSRTAGQDLGPLNIRGLVVIHPYFESEERIECEKAASEVEALAIDLSDLLWSLALPPGSDRDHPASNPRGPRSPDLRDLLFPPVLVTVAGLDMLKERGLLYHEMLQSCRKEAELMVAEGEIHAYHIFHPLSEATRLLQDRISQLIHRFDV